MSERLVHVKMPESLKNQLFVVAHQWAAHLKIPTLSGQSAVEIAAARGLASMRVDLERTAPERLNLGGVMARLDASARGMDVEAHFEHDPPELLRRELEELFTRHSGFFGTARRAGLVAGGVAREIRRMLQRLDEMKREEDAVVPVPKGTVFAPALEVYGRPTLIEVMSEAMHGNDTQSYRSKPMGSDDWTKTVGTRARSIRAMFDKGREAEG